MLVKLSSHGSPYALTLVLLSAHSCARAGGYGWQAPLAPSGSRTMHRRKACQKCPWSSSLTGARAMWTTASFASRYRMGGALNVDYCIVSNDSFASSFKMGSALYVNGCIYMRTRPLIVMMCVCSKGRHLPAASE